MELQTPPLPPPLQGSLRQQTQTQTHSLGNAAAAVKGPPQVNHRHAARVRNATTRDPPALPRTPPPPPRCVFSSSFVTYRNICLTARSPQQSVYTHANTRTKADIARELGTQLSRLVPGHEGPALPEVENCANLPRISTLEGHSFPQKMIR